MLFSTVNQVVFTYLFMQSAVVKVSGTATPNKAHPKPPSETSSSGSSSLSPLVPVWDLQQHPTAAQRRLPGVCAADLSSGGSSKFDESWPSNSGDDNGCGVGEGGSRGEEAAQQSCSSSRESTLARWAIQFSERTPQIHYLRSSLTELYIDPLQYGHYNIPAHNCVLTHIYPIRTLFCCYYSVS